jgi:hypothetical protein
LIVSFGCSPPSVRASLAPRSSRVISIRWGTRAETARRDQQFRAPGLLVKETCRFLELGGWKWFDEAADYEYPHQ